MVALTRYQNQMSGVLVPVKGVAAVGVLGAIGGFVAGFSFAERIYASNEQKSAVRTGASIAVAATAILAATAAVGLVRARAST